MVVGQIKEEEIELKVEEWNLKVLVVHSSKFRESELNLAIQQKELKAVEYGLAKFSSLLDNAMIVMDNRNATVILSPSKRLHELQKMTLNKIIRLRLLMESKDI